MFGQPYVGCYRLTLARYREGERKGHSLVLVRQFRVQLEGDLHRLFDALRIPARRVLTGAAERGLHFRRNSGGKYIVRSGARAFDHAASNAELFKRRAPTAHKFRSDCGYISRTGLCGRVTFAQNRVYREGFYVGGV